MTITFDDVRTELEVDFGLAREQFIAARHRQEDQDTPHHRIALAECWSRLDAILDLHLAAMNR
jgi:hypothetical protein